MSERTEFGFQRTVAGGPIEQINCKYLPGYLIPADLERIAKHMGFEDTKAWAMENLLASPGAKVGRIHKATGRLETFNIKTLVPARNLQTTHCKHLENGLCKIHEVAPFGCAFFDCQQSDQEANRRSSQGLVAVAEDWEKSGLYAQIWAMLYAAGKHAIPPAECRKRIDIAYERLKRRGKV